MAYIGNTPAEKYTSFTTQHFTVTATASYTLDTPVANENELALFINNVRQEPGTGYAYTAAGTALTLSAATAGTDTMYCVYLGKARQTVTPPDGSVTDAKLTSSGTMPAWNGAALTGITHTPANDSVDGAQLSPPLVAGDIIYADGTDSIERLAKGADDQILTLASGLPSWAAASAGGDTRNFIIDGDFTQWPEGTGARAFTDGIYHGALWRSSFGTGGGSATGERSTDTPTVGESGYNSSYSMLIKCTGTTTPSGSNNVHKDYYVTGTDFQYLHGQEITVSFWCKTAAANSGDTYYMRLENSARTRTYVKSFTATSSWAKITQTVTMDTTDTWLFTEADAGMIFGITFMVGPDRDDGTDGAWATGAYEVAAASPTCSNFMDSTSNEFYLSQVSIVKGSSAPSAFLGQPISVVLNETDYYVQRIGTDAANTRIGAGFNFSTTRTDIYIAYRRGMRTTPTLSEEGSGWSTIGGTQGVKAVSGISGGALG